MFNWIKNLFVSKQIDRKPFFDRVRATLFGGSLTQSQVDNLNIILDETEDLPLKQRAYVFATAYHETGGTMQPVREAFGSTDEETIRRLDYAYGRGRLNVSRPYWRKDSDGTAWFGRGYVQLTWKQNYHKAETAIGHPLTKNPDLALDPKVAAKILVLGMKEGWFTGKKLSNYLPGDYLNARKIVNGLDRAEQIAEYALKFEHALRGA